jgi:hypothetical protein
MPIPDFTSLTDDEIRQAIDALNALYAQRAADAAADADARRALIGQAIATLDGLLGPEGSPPYDPGTGANETINGVLAHDTDDHAVLAQYSGLALSLILRGMKINVSTVLNLAHVIGKDT